MQALFAAVGVYILFKEKTYSFQILGMTLLISCVVLLSFAQPGDSVDEHSTEGLMHASIPALAAVLSGFIFGIRIVLVKYAVLVQKYDGMAFSVGHPAIDAFFCSLAAAILLSVTTNASDRDHELLAKSIAAGFFNGIGNTCANYCVIDG